jgi:hypothetical protein
MRKLFTLGAAAVVTSFLVAGVVMAQEVSKEEKEMCVEAVKEVAGGKEIPAAIKLCEQGKTEEALEAAMKASES